MDKPTDASSEAPAPGITVGNMGSPTVVRDVEPLAGFAAEAAREGELCKVVTRLAVSSDQPLFHRLVEGVDGFVASLAEKAGAAFNLRRANTALLVFRTDKSLELWLDIAAVALLCTVNRAMPAGSLIYDRHISDVTQMYFPHVQIGPKDKVLCLFREGWGFGLAFDFNPDGALDLDAFQTSLGTLHRTLRYRHLYELVANQGALDGLIQRGWFPFAEIINAEFRDLARHAESGFDLAEHEAKILAAFDEPRLGHLLERWKTKPHLTARQALLEEAIEAFSTGRPASAIKIILTEIEGVLNDAHKAQHNGKGAKLKPLLAFVQHAGIARAGAPNTLLFPVEFGRYLAGYTFANFDPATQTGTAGSRHAVGHGAATPDSYTMARALQAFLTLDQIAFYT
jgi:hypothetical protein